MVVCYDIISTEEKQAAAKQAFVFPVLLTSKRPAKAGQGARKRELASEYMCYQFPYVF